VTSQTSRLFILCRCGKCGGSWVRCEPFPVRCDCGGEWLPERRAGNGDWATLLVVRRLVKLRNGAAISASGSWWGLDADGLAFCERVTTAACSDRWVKTDWYALAVALINATKDAARAHATRSGVAYTRYRKRVLAHLDHFQNALRASGIARS
jgi:hypothetical protein